MNDRADVPVFDWSHDVQALGERGGDWHRVATPDERARLAAALDLAACDRVEVHYTLKPLSRGRIRFKARIKADLHQRCVVTLAPVAARLDETVDLEFWPADDVDQAVDFDAMSPADPEPIEHGRCAVGRVVYEEIAAALDPYPRADGAALESTGDEETEGHKPFAMLARLKREE